MNLFEAVKKGFLSEIKACLARKEPVNMVDTSGFTPLHWAAITDNPYAIELLVQHGAKQDAPATKLNVTPLHMAALRNGAAAVQKLLALGANPNMETTNTQTPLDLLFLLNQKADLIGAFAEFMPEVKLAEKTNYAFDALLALLADARTTVKEMEPFNDVVINALMHDRADVVAAANRHGFHYKQLQEGMTLFWGGLLLPYEFAVGYDYALIMAMANGSVDCLKYMYDQDPDCFKSKTLSITGVVGRSPLIWSTQQMPEAAIFRAVQTFLYQQEDGAYSLKDLVSHLPRELKEYQEDIAFGYDTVNKRYYISKILVGLCALYFDEQGYPKQLDEKIAKLREMLKYLAEDHGIHVADADAADDYCAKFIVESALPIVEAYIDFGAKFRGIDFHRALRCQTPDVIKAMLPVADVCWKNKDGEDAYDILLKSQNDLLLNDMPELMALFQARKEAQLNQKLLQAEDGSELDKKMAELSLKTLEENLIEELLHPSDAGVVLTPGFSNLLRASQESRSQSSVGESSKASARPS